MKLSTIFTCLFAIVASASAQLSTNAPARLPIGSPDEARNYALDHVTCGSRYVTAPSINYAWNGTVTYIRTNGVNAESVLDGLFSSEMVYQLANTNDQVTGYIWLYDDTNSYDLMLFSSVQYHVGDKPQYTLWIQQIPLLSNVQSAVVYALNPDGSSSAVTYSQGVTRDHRMLFTPWLSGAVNGLLVVQFTDGSIVSYRLYNPVDVQPSAVTESANYKIEGHYVYEVTNSGPSSIDMSIVELFERPTAYISVPQGSTATAKINVSGVVQSNGQVSFEHPYSMTIYNEDTKTETTVNLDTKNSTSYDFTKGTYRIRFNWVNYGQPTMLYTGPASGGGIG